MIPTVSITVDYESPLARAVARGIWTGLSAAALRGGNTGITCLWESLGVLSSSDKLESSGIHIFAVGQDRPEAVHATRPVDAQKASRLYGVVVAVPDRPSPLAGSLLYQGVEKLTERGVQVKAIEPALLHALPKECESYAWRLLQRARET